MDKSELVKQIILKLSNTLTETIMAAEEAHKGATHDQSKAETQYDTLGLEHAYLAEGQGRRIEELRDQISQFHHLNAKPYHDDDPIYLGALVTLKQAQTQQILTVFLASCAGGTSIQWHDISIQVISTNSPLTKALLGLYLGDKCKLSSGVTYEIIQVQ